MRPSAVSVVVTAIAAVLLTGTAAAAELEWATATKGGVTLEKPTRWDWSVEDGGNTIWLYAGEYEFSTQVGLLVRKVDKDADASALARRWVEGSQFTDAHILDRYSFGDRDEAVAFATDRYHVIAARLGARVIIDRKRGTARYIVVRGKEKDFNSMRGWETVDRIFVSLGEGAAEVPNHRSWDWSVQVHDGIPLRVPDGWHTEVRKKGDTLSFATRDGETAKGSTFAFRVLRVPTNGKELNEAAFERAIVEKQFPYVRLLNGSDGHHRANVYGGGNARLAIRTTVRGGYAVAVLGIARPRAFWAADVIDVLDDFERHVGLPESELYGLWMGGSAGGVLLHYDGAGHFLDSSAEENGLLIAFYSDGTYEFRYMYSNEYSYKVKLASEESGHYSFDGFYLTLKPDKRVIHHQTYSYPVKTEVHAGKKLATIRATVHQVLTSDGNIEIIGSGFAYAGHFPAFQKGNPDASGFEFNRVPLDKVDRSAGFRKKGAKGKKKK